jgi:hypothetical protein
MGASYESQVDPVIGRIAPLGHKKAFKILTLKRPTP